ncbi:hypothetical protein PR048_023409 [Dryococelus australis]|uniref:Uncharacterized protein n=1 Tax=Dryococelus australis TaxID=614101 RepID=A0ABQ9GU67_9NEOP|nr:hypothetical protein PR048_023409 [Dryococelus australis]
MQKPPVNAYLRAGEIKNDGLFTTDVQTLMCQHCNHLVTYEKHDNIVKNIKTGKHKTAAIKSVSTSGNKIQTSVVASLNSAKRRIFAVDNLALKTTEAFTKANNPLEKVEDPNLKSWMYEFIEGVGELPCVRTLREKYVPKLAQEREDLLKDLFSDIKYVVTDSAQYMTKYVSSLQTLFGEHVQHVQCWAHKLALVGSVISCALQDVNEAVQCQSLRAKMPKAFSFVYGQIADPSAKIFRALNKVFSQKHILLNTTDDILPTIKCIPEFGDIEDSLLFK